MKENSYGEEIEIDLIDMFFYMVKKWRSLIIAIIIGAILGTGFHIVKSYQRNIEQNQSLNDLNEKADENFDEEKYNIEPDTLKTMEIAYQYRQLYNKQSEYNSKSIIMQLDPNAVYTGELKYYISAENNTGLLSVLYQNVINDENILEELKKASGLDCDTQYIKELIDSWTTDENGISIDINNSRQENNVSAVVKNAFVTYKVVSTSQRSCERMLQVIREKVVQLDTEAVEKYGNYSVVDVGDNVGLVTDNSYLTKQKSNVDQLNAYSTAVKNAENNFTDTEKEYYTKKYLAKEYAERVGTDEEKESLLEEVEVKPVSRVKCFLFAELLLIIIWGIYYAVRYIFDSRIKTITEYQREFRVPVIGSIHLDNDNFRGIDKIINDIYCNIKDTSNDLEYVIQAINSMNCGSVVACGDLENQDIFDKLVTECQNLKIEKFSSQSSESLRKVKVAEKEILLVSIGKTKRKELVRELECCKLQQIQVVGSILIDNM